MVGGAEYGFVSAYRAHRGKCVHALGTGCAGHKFHGKSSHSGGSNFLEYFRGTEGAQKSDQCLAFAEEREVGFSIYIVGTVAEDLSDDVRFGEDGGAVGRNGRTFICVMRVRVAGGGTGSGFDYYIKPHFGQHGDNDGDEGDSALVGVVFFGDADDHVLYSL